MQRPLGSGEKFCVSVELHVCGKSPTSQMHNKKRGISEMSNSKADESKLYIALGGTVAGAMIVYGLSASVIYGIVYRLCTTVL